MLQIIRPIFPILMPSMRNTYIADIVKSHSQIFLDRDYLPTSKQPTIAVIDADDDSRLKTCIFLKGSGFNVLDAKSAEDFYVLLLKNKVDLVVTEANLPQQNGLTLIQNLTIHGIPAILLASSSNVENRIAGLMAGALQYYSKPAEMKEVVAGICSILHSGALIQSLKKERIQGNAAPWSLHPNLPQLIAPNCRTVALTQDEFSLLDFLLKANSKPISKPQLLERFGLAENEYHRISTKIPRLRYKTLQFTRMDLPVHTIYGKGLVFLNKEVGRS